MMSQNITKCVLMLGLSVAISTAAYASQEGNANEKLLNEAISLLDQIKVSSPKAQSEVEQIRIRLDKIQKMDNYSDEEAPELMFSRMGATTTATSRNNKTRRVAFYNSCRGLRNGDLKWKLNSECAKHKAYTYKEARKLMYMDIDNHNGNIECVYTGKVVSVPAGKLVSDKQINCEHTWPQSKGATGDAKSDIHHLYPSDPKANCIRGNYPFGYVNKDCVEFSEGGSSFDGSVFEVRKQHRGNVARSMFYFSTVYKMPLDENQEKVLREWHKQDPVDANEIARNDKIESYQNNRNPFVDHPEYVDMIEDF